MSESDILDVVARHSPQATTHLVEYGVTEAAIRELSEKLVVTDCTVRENYEFTRRGIATCRELRVGIEKRRKDLKADSIEYGRKVDAIAKTLTARIEAIESPLQNAKDQVDAAKAAAKAAAEAKERAEREAAEAQRRAEEEARLQVERDKLEAERKAFEERQRLVNEQHERELAEQRRRAEEEAAQERERLNAERRVLEEQLRRQEEERKKLADEVARRDQEARDVIAARLQAEQAAKQAEEDAKQAEADRIKREQEDALTAAYQATLRPDAEKIRQVGMDVMTHLPRPLSLETPEARDFYARSVNEIIAVCGRMVRFGP